MTQNGEIQPVPNHPAASQEPSNGLENASAIMTLLPRYCEAMGDGITYEIVERFDIDGHEVAWLEFTGKVVYDITGQGNEGREFKGRDLKCQCEFTEGVGWRVEDGRKYNLDTDSCDAKEKVIEQRHEQLRDGYTERFRDDEKPELKDHIEEIVFDLIKRRKDGEFLEVGSGAEFYGGYFYLQTLQSVSGAEWGDVWGSIYRLMAENKIDREGMIVQEYRVPPPPVWNEYASLKLDGYTATAFLPTHSKMGQSWAIQLTGPNGELLEPNLGPRLGHIPIFGPDVDDVDDVDEVYETLQKVLEQAKTALPSERPPLQIAASIEE